MIENTMRPVNPASSKEITRAYFELVIGNEINGQ